MSLLSIEEATTPQKITFLNRVLTKVREGYWSAAASAADEEDLYVCYRTGTTWEGESKSVYVAALRTKEYDFSVQANDVSELERKFLARLQKAFDEARRFLCVIQQQKDEYLILRLRTKYTPTDQDPQDAANRIEALLHECAVVSEKHQDLIDGITSALNVPPGSDLVSCASELRNELYEAQEEITRLKKELARV